MAIPLVLTTHTHLPNINLEFVALRRISPTRSQTPSFPKQFSLLATPLHCRHLSGHFIKIFVTIDGGFQSMSSTEKNEATCSTKLGGIFSHDDFVECSNGGHSSKTTLPFGIGNKSPQYVNGLSWTIVKTNKENSLIGSASECVVEIFPKNHVRPVVLQGRIIFVSDILEKLNDWRTPW